MGESHGNVEVREGWTTVVVHVAISQFDECALEYAMAKILIDTVPEIGRNIANDTPKDGKAVGIDVVEYVILILDAVKYDQPNVNRE